MYRAHGNCRPLLKCFEAIRSCFQFLLKAPHVKQVIHVRIAPQPTPVYPPTPSRSGVFQAALFYLAVVLVSILCIYFSFGFNEAVKVVPEAF